jgi:(p)ppGpp synthase/HD superfamily hydrolase
MSVPLKKLTDYVIELGAARVDHSQRTYLAHAIGVYKNMKEWGTDDEVCCAAMFHSIYGTDMFQDFTLSIDRRHELRQLIGDRAECIAYANSAMNRESFDREIENHKSLYQLQDRITGGIIELSSDDFEELVRVHLCDWLEQVEKSTKLEWGYRRIPYRKMAERLGGVALDAYKEVFAREPTVMNLK